MADYENVNADFKAEREQAEREAINEMEKERSRTTAVIFVVMLAVLIVAFVVVKLVRMAIDERNNYIIENIVDQHNAKTAEELVQMYCEALAYGNSDKMLSAGLPDFYVAAAVETGRYDDRNSAARDFCRGYNLQETGVGFSESFGRGFKVQCRVLRDESASDADFADLKKEYSNVFGLEISDAHNVEYETVVVSEDRTKRRQTEDSMTAVKIGNCWYVALYNN